MARLAIKSKCECGNTEIVDAFSELVIVELITNRLVLQTKNEELGNCQVLFVCSRPLG